MGNVTVIPGQDDAAIAEWLHGRLSAALGAGEGVVTITVPGGSTPFPILERLSAMPLEWSRISIWPGDDRVVEEAHPASNFGRIRAIFEPVGAVVVPLEVVEKTPHFAFAWLGMGNDGHVASLFPNTDPRVDEPARVKRLTPDPLPPEAPFDRISLTIPALLDSGEIVFVIRGDDKLRVFEEALEGEHDLPVARLLGAATQQVACFT